MLDYAVEAQALTAGRSRGDLASDRLLNLAIVRLLEVIGEAASRVSEETRSTYPQVPWRQISNLRNRLIHGYDEVDFDILWTIIESDLPTAHQPTASNARATPRQSGLALIAAWQATRVVPQLNRG